MTTPTGGGEVGSTMNESRADPVMTALQTKACGLVELFEKLPDPLQMDGLDLLQGVVNSVIQKITAGRVTAVKFVPVGGPSVPPSTETSADHVVLTADQIKQETISSDEYQTGSISNHEYSSTFRTPAYRNHGNLFDNLQNHDCQTLTSNSSSDDLLSPVSSYNTQPIIISNVFSAVIQGITKGKKTQSAKKSSQKNKAPNSEKKSVPKIKIKLSPKKTPAKRSAANNLANASETHQSEKLKTKKKAAKKSPKSGQKNDNDNVDSEAGKVVKKRGRPSTKHKKTCDEPEKPKEIAVNKEQGTKLGEVTVKTEPEDTTDCTATQHANDKDVLSKTKDEIRAMFPEEVWAVRNAKKRTKIKGEARFECEDCDYKTNVKFHYDSHRIRHTKEKKFSCKICQKVFTAASTVKRHMLTHKDVEERPHACPVCPKKFCDIASLRTHAVVHTGERLYRCPYEGCSKVYTCHSNLSRHKRVHTGAMPYSCKFDGCDVKFRDGSSLKLHHLKHTGEKPCICQFCGMAFKTSSDKLRHERTHTNERKFECKLCNKKFVQGWHVKQHMRMHEAVGKFKCELCDKRVKTKSSLAHHMRWHAGIKPYQCDTCKKQFSTKTYLENHQVIHTNDKPFKCKTCNKRFNQISNMKRHERMHSDKVRYTCKYCEKGFKYINSWRYHVQSLHEGVKHTCEKCGVSFQCRRTLKFHRCAPLSIDVPENPHAANSTSPTEASTERPKAEKLQNSIKINSIDKLSLPTLKIKLNKLPVRMGPNIETQQNKRKSAVPQKRMAKKVKSIPTGSSSTQVTNNDNLQNVVGKIYSIEGPRIAGRSLLDWNTNKSPNPESSENPESHVQDLNGLSVIIKKEPEDNIMNDVSSNAREIKFNKSGPSDFSSSGSSVGSIQVNRSIENVPNSHKNVSDNMIFTGLASKCHLDADFSSPSKGRGEISG